MTANDNTKKSIEFAFDLLGKVVEKKDEENISGTDALAFALVAWVAGPDQPLTAGGLSHLLNAITKQTYFWNAPHEDGTYFEKETAQ